MAEGVGNLRGDPMKNLFTGFLPITTLVCSTLE
jgi:hypothetical protein